MATMRVLLVHNAYRYRGGEDEAVENDRALLESKGHEVSLYLRTFDELSGISAPSLALQALWSARTYVEVRRLIRARRPQVLHAHNIFPLISAAVYHAAHAERVPVVQTLHNYRLVCPAATLLRDGQPCELCVGRVPIPAVRYRCYRGSRAQSLVLSTILTIHRGIGTWDRGVDAYIALTEFGRRIFVRGGLASDRIFVRPNAVPPPTPGATSAGPRHALFLGRLSVEKGVRVLIDAWRSLSELPLDIAGDGPLREEIQRALADPALAHVRLLGPLSHSDALDQLATARVLVFPSVWYEGLPYSIVEALALGVPVIASRLGAQAEVVRDGVSGLLFSAGKADALRDAVRRIVSSPALAEELADGARREYRERFSLEQSYRALIDVYDRVLTRKH